MSRRSIPTLHSQGVSRIFQQSVKQLGQQESHGSIEGKKDSRQRDYESKDSHMLNNDKERKFPSSNTDKVNTGRESVDFSSACNSKPVNAMPGGTCQRQQYRERNRVMEVKSVASDVINHFAEDWTSDELTQETDDTNTLKYGPLQSTPKKQSKVGERNADKFDAGSECVKNSDENVAQFVDPNDKEVKNSDRKSNNGNIPHEKKLPINVQSNQSVSIELNKVQIANKLVNGNKEEISSVREVHNSLKSKLESSAVLYSRQPGFSVRKNKSEIPFMTEGENKENVCTKETQMEVNMMSNLKQKTDDNEIHSTQIITSDASSYGEIQEKEDKIKPVFITQKNISKIPSIQNDSKAVGTLQKLKEKDKGRNQHDNVIMTSTRDYEHNSRSYYSNEPWKMKHPYKYKGNDSKCNWPVRHSLYTYNRKYQHELKANLPPRFSKEFNHQKEQKPYRSLCRSAREKGKPMKKLLISNDQVRVVDVCDKPVFSQKFGQLSSGLTDSVHHSKETEPVQSSEKGAEEEFVARSQDDKIQEKLPDVCQSWVIPCSEDWLAEISEEKNAHIVKQDSINTLNVINTIYKYETDRIRVDQTTEEGCPLKSTVSLQQPNTSDRNLIHRAENCEDKCLVASVHEGFTGDSTEDFEDVKTCDAGLKFDTNGQDVLQIDKLNSNVKPDALTCTGQIEEAIKNSVPYLPPPPPSSEYMYVSVKYVANTDENCIDDSLVEDSVTTDNMSGSEDHERHLPTAEDEKTLGTSYILACKDDDIDNTKRDDNSFKFASGTSEDVSELPPDEVVDNISDYDSCSPNFSNLDRLDGPRSQENTLDYGDGNETGVDTATSQNSQWPVDCMTDDDYKSWLNFQYDSAYWSWYYYMCSKSIKNNMQWQTQAYNTHVKGMPKRKVQQTGRSDKGGCDHVKRKNIGKHTEPMNEAPPSDLVTDRTTSWVNSQVFHNPSSQTSTPQSHMQGNTSRKDYPRDSHDYKLKTPNDNCNKTNVALDVSDTTRLHYYHLNSAETDETHLRDMHRDEGLHACYCSDRNIQYVTWRMCYCGPPRLYGVYYQRDPNLDLGYWSYESNTGTDQEERTLLDKGNGLLYRSPSPSEHQWAPARPMEGKAVEKHHLYEDFVGGRGPPGFQQVYMLHSTALEEAADKDRKRLSSDRLHPDHNEEVCEMDENHNNRQQVNRNPGKLRKIIEEMDKDSASQKSAENTDNDRRGSRRSKTHAKYEPSSVNYTGSVFDGEQDVLMESLHSNTHLSEVEKNLLEAEEVNDKLGKSFFVMKNAIAAIKRYTDQLKAKCDNSDLSTENDQDRVACETDKADGLDSVSYTRLEPDNEDNIDDDFDHTEDKTGDGVRPKIRPFKLCTERKHTFELDSSSGHPSESSDDVCKESFLSQSPDTNSKAGSYTQKFLSNLHRNNPKSVRVTESPRMLPRHIRSYRGGGMKCAVSGDLSARSSSVGSWDSGDLSVRSSGKGPWNRKIPIDYDTIKATSGKWCVEPSFPAYNMQYIEDKYCNTDALIDAPKHTDLTGPPTVSNVTPKCKIPKNQTGSEEKDPGKTYIPWKPKLVDYTESGESSSDIEIEPFDVDSLSSDHNPSSVKEDRSNISPVSQCKPKKCKHDNTLDDVSSSSCESSRMNSPVEFMRRPQRKLSHRHLKCLSTSDVPPVTFVKAGNTHRKYPQQYTATERKFRPHRRYSTGQESVSTKGEESLSAFIASQKKSLPPVSPFPQSQFWNMYLPKYNSALTGTRESISPKPDERQDTRLSATPESRWTTPKCAFDRTNDTTVSQLETDTERTKRKPSDWRNTFKRFHSFGVKYIDTHCHLDFLFKREGFYGNLQDYMTQFPDTFPDTFEGCVAVFCNPLTFTPEGGLWKEVAKEDNVWFAMGCHPKNATDFTEAAEEGLQKCLQHSKCVALGEIGLDYSGTFQQHEEVQKAVFRKQLKIAVKMDKPLVIHCRQAEDDCLDILKEMVPKDHKIHCHCFTGYYYNAKQWLDAFPNLYIGITPLVTYTTARPSHDLARNIPLNRLLLETDAPYFIPRSIPREDLQYSNPGLAVTVAKEVAQYQELPVAAILRHCRLNTKFMYGI